MTHVKNFKELNEKYFINSDEENQASKISNDFEILSKLLEEYVTKLKKDKIKEEDVTKIFNIIEKLKKSDLLIELNHAIGNVIENVETTNHKEGPMGI